VTDENARLEREVARLNKINQALIGRVERAMNMQGDAFALFQAATVLEQKVKERTSALEQALRELRLTNRDLQKAKETAEAAVRFKDEFLASMSHELRTPLNAVLGLSETLQDGVYGAVNDKQQECLRTIESSGRHLLSLINDILDVTKLGAGELRAERTLVALRPLCEGCLSLVEQQARAKQIELNLSLVRSPKAILSDEKRLKQILVNLLSNAVKFTPNLGSVELRVEREGDGCTSFSVTDTGIGIAEADLARVFLPFVQVESSLSRSYDGTGLGLALVQQLTTLLGGTVQVESETGRGSKFSVRFSAAAQHPGPAALEAVTPPVVERLSPAPSLESHAPIISTVDAAEAGVSLSVTPASAGHLVLLTEDNPANQATIGGYLSARGYRLALARNGREAVELASRLPVDIILMDVQMPEMDGLEAIRRIRAYPERRRVPIIALTALAMVGDRERCIEAGADEYLSKPLVLRDLVGYMEAHLAAWHPSA
jgi:signal transduction histidine kinase/ActR/RegA family two-component response regulator